MIFVSVANSQSDKLSIASGVPQCRILGPLLFLMFIKNIVNMCTAPQLNFIMYANDTSVFSSSNNKCLAVSETTRILDKINFWTIVNNLRLNCTKRKVVIFQIKNTPINRPVSLVLDDEKTQLVPSVKTLDVWFSEDMSWNSHIEYI